MAKPGALHVFSAERNAVPSEVLESIITGTYNRDLTEDEARALEAVPQPIKQWFEEIAINSFYLLIRHFVTPTSVSGANTTFLELLIDELTQSDRAKTKNSAMIIKTMRGSYESRQRLSSGQRVLNSRSLPFEQAVANSLASYTEGIIGNVRLHYQDSLPFSYIPRRDVIDGLRRRFLG
ncbi:MAG TPA: hypothetical protein VI934_01860 [Candidatus Nanoarchaeia archaeon]|nr:hypothetical protein [Candidatus Nanoarchaeia archaeon]